ncbi:sodium-coupled monocarboxylate transporter 1-like isoform X2 [Saccostrea echinata]|uniref:sodium-coupled monocarboxylate transporter 1-like isoform X2 n=1 Tax=Saccostrea echinata TaxID=191078 RepID=UPI002A7FB09F|nr:sodium-coupled monocarboxylate transporter 1-like isoform X2 [Saccostrea echinata]
MTGLPENSFTVVDWAVFSGLLIISACIGVYYALVGGKQKTTKEFLMANRNLKIVPVAISILVSFLSAILILGAPAEMYTKGTQYYLYVFGQMTAAALAAVLFVPLFYPLKLTSMFQYIELRFKSRAARLTATVINIFASLTYTGIASFAPATALRAVTGFPEWASFLLIGFVCTFYTFMGGLKAVVWVDAFQAIIMFGTLLTIVTKATLEVGGFSKVWELNDQWGRINFWNFDFDPTVRHTFWALTIGGMINWVGTFGASQQSIQRFSALASLREAKIAVLLNCVGLFIMVTTACLAGISVFAFYAMKGCDPYTNKEIKSSNQIIPLFVIQMLHVPGVPGLFIAGLFSGALSSVSSNLSSQVATTWEDIIKPHVKNKSEIVHAWITRMLVILFGILGLGVSFAVRKLGGTVLQVSLSFMGAASGALNGFVVLGAFFPSCNWIGAMVGPLVSYAVMMWIGIAKYSVIGVKEKLDFPTETCAANLNLTTPMTSVNLNMLNYSIPHINQSMVLTNISIDITTHAAEVAKERSALHDLYSLSYLWYSTLGLFIAVFVGLCVSVVTGPMKKEEVDPKYLIPVCDWLCCCLPDSWRKKCCCGTRHDEDQTLSNPEENINSDINLVLMENKEIGDGDGPQINGNQINAKSNVQLLFTRSLQNS